MWKKPAVVNFWRGAALFSALALVLSVPRAARADTDFGLPVSFGASESLPLSLSLNKSPSSHILYQSGESDSFTQSWTTALIEGTEGDRNLVFELSKRMADGTWSPWVSAEIHIYKNGRFWSRADLPSGNGTLRFQIMDGGIKSRAKVFISDIEAYDSSNQAVISSTQTNNPPDPILPPLIHSRKEWNAKPTKNAYDPQTPWRITIHHTAGPQTMTLNESLREVGFIQDFQQNGRGWDDIGYHFLIDGAGNIIEGRPINAMGSHVHKYNDGNVGIAMMGYFNKPVNDHLTSAQLGALVALIRYLSTRYNIPISNVKGHRDYEQTDCPGDNVYSLLPKIRTLASRPAPTAKPMIVKRPPVVISWPNVVQWDGQHSLP